MKTYTDAKLTKQELVKWKEALRLDFENSRDALDEIYGSETRNDIQRFQFPKYSRPKILESILKPEIVFCIILGLIVFGFMIYLGTTYSPGSMNP